MAMIPENTLDLFLNIVLAVQGVLLLLCLIRSIIGPRITDRIVAVNMVGTNAIAAIAVLAVKLRESYVADICLIYAMVSFLAVILLTKVYMGVYLERQAKRKNGSEKEADEK